MARKRKRKMNEKTMIWKEGSHQGNKVQQRSIHIHYFFEVECCPLKV
jgi:hypothetical protein